MGKESANQAQILETTGEEKKNMKQETRKTSQKRISKNQEQYQIIEKKKLARYANEESTDDQPLPKVTTTNKIVTDISTAPKEKVKTRCQISVKRLGTVK